MLDILSKQDMITILESNYTDQIQCIQQWKGLYILRDSDTKR